MIVKAVSDLAQGAKVKLRAGHRAHLACWDQLGIDRQIVVGIYHELMAEDITPAGEIEIAVICEV